MASREQCEHCKSTFQNKTILKTHINTNKKCLALRGLSLQTNFICEGCNIMLITVSHLHSHYEICRQYIVSKLLQKHEKELQEQSNNYEKKLKEQRIYYEKELKELKESISKKKKYKEIDQEISNLKGIVKTLKSNFDYIKIKNDVTSLNSSTEKLEFETETENIQTTKETENIETTKETENIETTSTEVGYNYLIQEREHLLLNQPVFKTGMSIQSANNQINRLKQGYKKGSKILFIACCKPEEARERETKIKNELKKKFKNHTDGIEHFIGDYKEMMKIMMDICCV